MDASESEPMDFFSMALPKKSFMLFDPGGNVIPSLSAIETLKEEWSFLPVRSIDTLKKIHKKDSAWVGLAYVPEDLTEPRYHALLSISEISCRWIALLAPAGLGNPHVLRLIDEVCYDFHLLPVDAGRLRIVMGRAHGMARVNILNERSSDGGKCRVDLSLLGSSPVMQELLRKIRKVACVEAPVLIVGERGTGKEMAARAIHERSNRRKNPFISINCKTIPEHLIRSELFGYEKGAFAGATRRKTGPVEAAHAGTIMLDAIEDLPMDLQMSLLRMLETGKIQRVGSPLEIPVDVRLVAATHVDLEKACREGLFLEELLHRLSLVEIDLPPLREREGDIIDLALHFFRKFAADRPVHPRGFTPAALRGLLRHHWPGNVRELADRIQRAVHMSDAPLIRPEDLLLNSGENDPELPG